MSLLRNHGTRETAPGCQHETDRIIWQPTLTRELRPFFVSFALNINPWQPTLTRELRRTPPVAAYRPDCWQPTLTRELRLRCGIFIKDRLPGNPHSRANCDSGWHSQPYPACAGNPHSRANCDLIGKTSLLPDFPGNPHSRANCDPPALVVLFVFVLATHTHARIATLSGWMSWLQ